MRHLPIHGLAVLSVITLTSCGEITDLSGPESTELPLGSVLNLDVAMVSADALIEDMARVTIGLYWCYWGRARSICCPCRGYIPATAQACPRGDLLRHYWE